MPYDFERIVNRRGTASLKWDVEEQELPMWVADMDFQTAPEIMAAIRERADHGIFGYTVVPDAWYKAIQDWWKKRHGFLIEKEWLLFSTGVVPAISSIVRKMTTAGENIVIQTPVYNVFSIPSATTAGMFWKAGLGGTTDSTGLILRIWKRSLRIPRQP